MTIEEEIARTLRDADPEPYFAGDWTAERYYAELAQSLSPLLNRVRAEAIREAARFLRSSDNPQRSSEFRRESYVMDDAGYQLFVRADRIEQKQ